MASLIAHRQVVIRVRCKCDTVTVYVAWHNVHRDKLDTVLEDTFTMAIAGKNLIQFCGL